VLGDSVTEDEEIKKAIEADAAVATWMKSNVTAEIERLKQNSANAIPIPVCYKHSGKNTLFTSLLGQEHGNNSAR